MTNADLAGGYGLIIVLFIGGLLGSFAHCAAMCGPFVVAQSPVSSQAQTGFTKLAGKGRLFYHLGRGTTYTALGTLAAYFSSLILPRTGHMVSATLLTMAAIIFVWMAMPSQGKPAIRIPKSKFGFYLGRLITPLTKPFAGQRTIFHQYMMGVLLGFIPCGMLYAALMAVAASGNVTIAALAMVAFVLGTMPSLLLIAFSQETILGRYPRVLRGAARIAMAFNAVILIKMATAMAT